MGVPGFTTIVVNLLHEEKSRRERSQLRTHAGPNVHTSEALGMEGGQVDRPAARSVQIHNTAFMASLDLKTAFDVAKPFKVSKILTLTRVHGHLTVAFLAEIQDVRGSSSFQNSETGFRCGGPSVGGTCGQVCAVES